MSGPQVFISYNHGSKAPVRALRSSLEAAGFTIWMDESEMGGGDALYGSIDEGIRNCLVVISCISPKYCQSENCQREVALADVVKKPIVPCIFEKVPWPPAGDMSLRMCKLLYIDFTKGDKTDEVISQLKKYSCCGGDAPAQQKAAAPAPQKAAPAPAQARPAQPSGPRSGRWSGHFTDARTPGKQWPINLFISFLPGGAIEAKGIDEIGEFNFIDGRVHGNQVTYEKKYVGAHSIMYEGKINADMSITGKWRHPGRRDYGGDYRMASCKI